MWRLWRKRVRIGTWECPESMAMLFIAMDLDEIIQRENTERNLDRQEERGTPGSLHQLETAEMKKSQQ